MHRNDAITLTEFENRFSSDYINNMQLYDSLNISENSKNELKCSAEIALSNYKVSFPDVHDGFLGVIQNVLTVKWLSETGYGLVLSNKINQLKYYDDYGDLVSKDAEMEVEKFVKRKLIDIIYAVDNSIDEFYIDLAMQLNIRKINYMITDDRDVGPDYLLSKDIIEVDNAKFLVLNAVDDFFEVSSNVSFTTKDPYMYEHIVADEFSKLGWQTRVTSGSGDQGADVIAKNEDLSLVIQCKLYSKPVGNKAVQEVASAKVYYNCDISVVVTNNTFTKSAKQLASSLDVSLIHHNQIDKFNTEILKAYKPKIELLY